MPSDASDQQRPSARTSRIAKVTSVVAIAATALWVGGLLTLGAIVAPIVFRTVPAPWSAQAMTLVFRRFDRVAMACAVVVLLVEAARAALGLRLTRIDVVRACVALAAGMMAVWQGVSLSPRIEALFLGGAVRGLGETGLELEALHRLAEAAGKMQTVLALVLIALHVVSAPAPGPSRAPAAALDSARP